MHNYEIRPLDETNVDWFANVASVNMFTDELKRPDMINMQRIYLLSNQFIENGTAFVVSKDGNNCGAIGGFLTENLFQPSIRTLAEIVWYVLPEYRNSRAGYLLLKAFEKRGRELADEITLSILPSSSVNTETLNRMGFTLSELAFRKGM